MHVSFSLLLIKRVNVEYSLWFGSQFQSKFSAEAWFLNIRRLQAYVVSAKWWSSRRQLSRKTQSFLMKIVCESKPRWCTLGVIRKLIRHQYLCVFSMKDVRLMWLVIILSLSKGYPSLLPQSNTAKVFVTIKDLGSIIIIVNSRLFLGDSRNFSAV